jgi:hypothetical protein
MCYLSDTVDISKNGMSKTDSKQFFSKDRTTQEGYSFV